MLVDGAPMRWDERAQAIKDRLMINDTIFHCCWWASVTTSSGILGLLVSAAQWASRVTIQLALTPQLWASYPLVPFDNCPNSTPSLSSQEQCFT